MKAIKLWYWKRRLRSAYLSYIHYEADCGAFMTEYISGRRTKVNDIIAKINALDPTANLKSV